MRASKEISVAVYQKIFGRRGRRRGRSSFRFPKFLPEIWGGGFLVVKGDGILSPGSKGTHVDLTGEG